VQWLVDPATGLSEELLKCKNDAGMDAFTLACMKGHLRVVEMLVDRLSKSSFLPSQIQRAHDLHQAASIQEKYNLNRALVKYLREWMQEMQYGQASESPEEETVEVLTMREMLAKSDLSRTVGGGGVGGGQGTTDSSALLGSSSSSAPIPEAETEEDESEEEEDEEEEESESASKPLSSPPALDNAHLKRSALINDATTVADATIVPSQ
jgi:hypothetical protein